MDDPEEQRSSHNNEDKIQHELSESDSASCNSISNPYYDGPNGDEEGGPIEEPLPSERRGSSRGAHLRSPIRNKNVIIIAFDLGYFKTCIGFLRLIQLILTSVTLMCLVLSGRKEGGLLLLPLSWHFRIMLFVLVLTFLVSLISLVGNITTLTAIFAIEWNFVDMVLYSVFAFLYLVGTSLVASAFDFYQKMKTNVSNQTVQQLMVVVILGYICMAVYGMTALVTYRQWRIQYRLYQRRKLLEEDEIDL